MGMLDKIILLLSGVVEIYMLYDFFENAFDIRKGFTKGRVLGATLSACAVLFAINMQGSTYMNLFGLPTVLFWYSMVLFKTTLGQRILYVLIVEVAILCGEFFLTVLLEVPPRLMKMGAIANLSDIKWQIFSAKLLAYVILAIVKHMSGKGKHYMPRKVFLLYLCQPIAGLTIMMLSYYANMNMVVTDDFKIALTIGFACLVIGNILMFYAFNQYAKQTTLAREQEVTILKQNADVEYYMQAAEMNQQHRKLVHDTAHYMKVIGELAREKKNDSITKLVNEITGELEHIRTLVYCDNPVLNAILQEKKHEGEKQEITMDIYVEPEIHTEQISDMDMVTMLGNLLDNAVRAASACDRERYVRVRIFTNKERGFLVFKIVNPYAGELLYKEDGFASTKKEKGIHGIGLKNVESTAEKYCGYLECKAEQQIFTAVLLIKGR
ncbi:MAG: GHKL domain-containing protein [Lachnospiraceae bacterium]|nr:GHKL domain-containing protein [Lachnospiraceae bacterium]